MPKVYYYDFSGDNYSIYDLKPFLSPERYNYCCNMKCGDAALRSAYGYMLLRYALKKEYEITDIPQFVLNEYGKPFLADHKDIFFNFSHSGKRVVCAVDTAPIGVDIQDIRHLSLKIGEKFLSESEMRRISGITDDIMLDRELSRIWCIKESYGKMTGKGFGEGFRSFDTYDLMKSGQAFLTEKDGMFISVCVTR